MLEWAYPPLKGQPVLKWDVPILTMFFTLNWLILTPKTHFVQIYQNVAFNLLSWGKNKNVTLGMRPGDEALIKIHKKIKIGILEIGYCYNSEFEAEILGL